MFNPNGASGAGQEFMAGDDIIQQSSVAARTVSADPMQYVRY